VLISTSLIPQKEKKKGHFFSSNIGRNEILIYKKIKRWKTGYSENCPGEN